MEYPKGDYIAPRFIHKREEMRNMHSQTGMRNSGNSRYNKPIALSLAIAALATFTFALDPAHGQNPPGEAVPNGNQAQGQPPVQPQQGLDPAQAIKDTIGRAVGNQALGQPALNNQGPILAPPISFVDINSGRFGKLDIDMEDGQFLDSAAKHLHLTARNLDLNEGILKSLDINVQGGTFQDFTIDQLTLSTAGDLNFDTGILLNHKILRFTTPAQAQVSATISQASLNSFINSPQTLQRLSYSATKSGGMLASLLGGMGGNVGFSLTQGDIKLAKANSVNLNLITRVGIGQVGVPIPVDIKAKLGLKDGWLEMQDTQVSTNGQQLPPEIAKLLVNKVNGLSNWGKRSDDIQFSFTELKVIPGKQFILKGTAEVKQLRFSRLRT
jgi:hypothetical protein